MLGSPLKVDGGFSGKHLRHLCVGAILSIRRKGTAKVRESSEETFFSGGRCELGETVSAALFAKYLWSSSFRLPCLPSCQLVVPFQEERRGDTGSRRGVDDFMQQREPPEGGIKKKKKEKKGCCQGPRLWNKGCTFSHGCSPECISNEIKTLNRHNASRQCFIHLLSFGIWRISSLPSQCLSAAPLFKTPRSPSRLLTACCCCFPRGLRCFECGLSSPESALKFHKPVIIEEDQFNYHLACV